MSNEQGPFIDQSSVVGNFIKDNANKALVLGVAVLTVGGGALALTQGGEAMPVNADGVPCDPEMDVCVPDVTAAPDAEPVPGNPTPGDTIVIDEEFDDKGPDSTTSTTSTTTTSTVPHTTSTTMPHATTTTSTVTPTTMPHATTTTSTVTPTTHTTLPKSSTTTVSEMPQPFCEVGDFDNDGDKDFRFVDLFEDDIIKGVHFDVDAPECSDIEPPVTTLPPVVETVPTIPQETN